jgi:hypothetical protein
MQAGAATTTHPSAAGNASPALFLLSLALLVVMIIGHKRAEVPRTKLEPIHPRAGTGQSPG